VSTATDGLIGMDKSDNSKLIKALAEACDAVGGVEKKGTNEAQRYKYVKAADIAKAIRHELFGRGIVILQSEHEPDFVEVQLAPDRDGKPRSTFEVRICTDYTLTDGVGSVTLSGWGVARDSGDKAIWKAKTGALKYFLRGIGLIPDEKEDPEYDKGEKPESRDEMGEMDQDSHGVIRLAGILEEEKQSKDNFWYKVRTLDEDGRETLVYVVSPVASDSGRLAERVGWLVDLQVRPTETTKAGVFTLVKVLNVRKPVTSVNPPSASPTQTEQADLMTSEIARPGPSCKECGSTFGIHKVTCPNFRCKQCGATGKSPDHHGGCPKSVEQASGAPEPAPLFEDDDNLTKIACHVTDTEKRTTKAKKPYWLLQCAVEGAGELPVHVWDSKLFDRAQALLGKDATLGCRRSEKDDKVYYALEQIY